MVERLGESCDGNRESKTDGGSGAQDSQEGKKSRIAKREWGVEGEM